MYASAYKFYYESTHTNLWVYTILGGKQTVNEQKPKSNWMTFDWFITILMEEFNNMGNYFWKIHIHIFNSNATFDTLKEK